MRQQQADAARQQQADAARQQQADAARQQQADAARQQQVVAAAAAPRYVQRVAVKLPAFWLDKPAIWFAQAEAQFALADITVELTKYYHVISQLDVRAASEVEDIISSPPGEFPYTNLRQRLIERLSTSEEHRVRQLLHDEELGDRKPSQFLRHLKSLAAPTVVQLNLLRHLWLRRLPTHVQTVLTARPELSLEQLSDLADKIVEISPVPSIRAVAENAEQVPAPNDSLATLIRELTFEVSALRTRRRERSPDQRSRSRSASSRRSSRDLCWYHYRFDQSRYSSRANLWAARSRNSNNSKTPIDSFTALESVIREVSGFPSCNHRLLKQRADAVPSSSTPQQPSLHSHGPALQRTTPAADSRTALQPTAEHQLPNRTPPPKRSR
ncbi:unnamed protein product [Trichogramma brassicae]|uniref:DUF7041 domain-containing protein n=1 Tax=Trichogramma brassicae TaxID=86971 RepID=A0A6H5IGY8_9HYME|nr:unnamed protein product [Trichogramma brassicae]